ncbi:reverse transcriptase domain-containing protein [Flavobacterium sp. 22076]|uniref:reverse transcriptase domain-containing protein n=1 Tax=unclassified Flavobacterium TaxID=196869 RepID=UPI003F83A7A6
MKQFEDFFTENEILRQICKIRVKLAKSKSKKHLLHLLTLNSKYNYHLKSNKTPSNEFEQYQHDLTIFLRTILPPRKRWVKLGENSRKKQNCKNEFLTSNDKNFYSLLKTIKLQSRKEKKEQWYLNLQDFIIEVTQLSKNPSYSIGKPIIFPKLKDKLKKVLKEDEFNECRPICIFSLKDRIILSATNKFLTQLFDQHFQDSSYAFRSKKNDIGTILSHHDCINDILKYKNENSESDLYVTECDMKKFYDTVNHSIAKKLFYELIEKSQLIHSELDLSIPINIFENYLDCFAFNIDIPKSSDTEYWLSYRIPKGDFSWVNNVISVHYLDIALERIGVPQGGALSGLIANIYLNEADIALSGNKFLYQRFCDDMIIISDSLEDCTNAKKIYENALHNLKLFPHPFKDENNLITVNTKGINYKNFWDGKSKGPYKWGEASEKSFPWIGFVGYEINYLNEIRVRKRSLHKELKKQKTIVQEIRDAVKFGMRKSKGSATESAISRLIGMSVGRIGINNFDEVSTDMCWKNGFKVLNFNKHSLRQIKQLDRNRSKQYYKLLKEIEHPELIKKKGKSRETIKYNKPFSYYYQILERQQQSIN